MTKDEKELLDTMIQSFIDDVSEQFNLGSEEAAENLIRAVLYKKANTQWKMPF